MPLDKGLAPLANGTNWRIASAALCSLWLFLAMPYGYAPTKEAIGLPADTVSAEPRALARGLTSRIFHECFYSRG